MPEVWRRLAIAATNQLSLDGPLDRLTVQMCKYKIKCKFKFLGVSDTRNLATGEPRLTILGQMNADLT